MMDGTGICRFVQPGGHCPCPAPLWGVCAARALEEALRPHASTRVGDRVRDSLVEALVRGGLKIPSGLTSSELVDYFSRLVRRTVRWRTIDERRRGDLPMAA